VLDGICYNGLLLALQVYLRAEAKRNYD